MTYTDAFEWHLQVFKHKHEIESGRTSSLSHQLLGYAADGKLLQMCHPSKTSESLFACHSAKTTLVETGNNIALSE